MPSRWTSAWRRRRPCSTTRWFSSTATKPSSALRADGRTLEFIKDQYRHCKPILALGPGKQLLDACGIDARLPDGQPDPGLIIATDTKSGADDFVAAIAKHRHFARETDPPRV